MMSKIPYIGELNGVKTLFVNDKPFLVRGGELHNSSYSSLEYMEERVWPMLKTLHMNTVVLPIGWENIEEVEGVFDFTLVDGLISQARREGMKLVFLWFGLWKNSESNYVPMWVKKNYETYFRVEDAKGNKLNIISPFCQAAVEKDAYAFSKLMAHIKEVDEEENTVIFMQIENEIGILGAERDFSDYVTAIYNSAVPEDIKTLYADGDPVKRLEGALRCTTPFKSDVNGTTWEEVFGVNACEALMAYGYANAVETIAKAGKAEYDLPMYVNAWLEQHPWRPGTYPCGGPVMKVKKMWKHCAPSLFTLAPDIYVAYTADVMDEYTADDNPLFVPEVRKDPAGVSTLLYAFGKNNAIGVSPFGIEDVCADPSTLHKPPIFLMLALNIDVSAMDPEGTAPFLRATYDLIEQMEPLYLQYRNTPKMQAFIKRNEVDDGILLSFEKYDIVVSYKRKEDKKPVSTGIIFELAEDKFLFLGMNYSFKIYPKMGSRKEVVHGVFKEGRIENGEFIPKRILNGDERGHVSIGEMPSALMIDVYEI